MERISAHDLAREIISDCLDYGHWPTRTLDALIERALDEDDPFSSAAATRALFSGVVEPLADLFDPQLCEIYARLFTRVIARVLPDYDANDLLLRYGRIRQPEPFMGGEITRVFVLSRVTFGADVAVTSVALSAAKQRFPQAEICLVGPEKNAGLFAADPNIVPVPVAYGRRSVLRERLLAAVELRSIVDQSGSIVIDPDSRLTQLGLIPICDDSRYYFFESRAFGGSSEAGLPELTALWANQVFGVDQAAAYSAPVKQPRMADCCVSWGVGENENKRIGNGFERQVLSDLLARGLTVAIDRGAGGAEGERVDALVRDIDSPSLKVHDGSYASFASQILQSRLYVGYDSAGQHVAAAAGVPLVSIFSGAPDSRFFGRWKPRGPKAIVLRRSDPEESQALLAAARAAIQQLA